MNRGEIIKAVEYLNERNFNLLATFEEMETAVNECEDAGETTNVSNLFTKLMDNRKAKPQNVQLVQVAQEVKSIKPIARSYNMEKEKLINANISENDWELHAEFLEAEIEDYLDEEDVEYNIWYEKNREYYDTEIEGGHKVLVSKVNCEDYNNNYFITSDGLFFKVLKGSGKMKPVSIRESSMTHVFSNEKRHRKSTVSTYWCIGALVYKTFIDRDYEYNKILYNDRDFSHLSIENLSPCDGPTKDGGIK